MTVISDQEIADFSADFNTNSKNQVASRAARRSGLLEASFNDRVFDSGGFVTVFAVCHPVLHAFSPCICQISQHPGSLPARCFSRLTVSAAATHPCCSPRPAQYAYRLSLILL